MTVDWPERTRGLPTTASALSGKIVLSNASVDGKDVTILFDRNPSHPEGHSEAYPLGQPLAAHKGSNEPNVFDLTAWFYAQPGQQGDLVAYATAQVDADQVGMDIDHIALSGKVKWLYLSAQETVIDKPPTQLAFVAHDIYGHTLALSPGSARWNVSTGQDRISVSPDGLATGLVVGTPAVTVSVDGATSAPGVVNVYGKARYATIPSADQALAIVDGQILGSSHVQGTAWDATTLAVVYSAAARSFFTSKSGPTYSGYALKISSAGHSDLQYGGIVTPPGQFVSFEPAASGINGASGNQQVGWAGDHAALFHSTYASRIDLNPSRSTESVAYCTDGTNQGGYATFGSRKHAGLWQGTAASFVDLHPAGVGASCILATDGTNQVGWTSITSGLHRAGMWSGTAGSFRDLHPAGAESSQAYAIAGRWVVGEVTSITDTKRHMDAMVWDTTNGLTYNLDKCLPLEWGDSVATGAEIIGDELYIVGNSQQVVRWTIPLSDLP